MAQNSDGLQEPSMDELLASIREIIEENAGIPPQGNGQQHNSGDAGQPAAMEGGSRYGAPMPNLRQGIFVRNDGGKPAQPSKGSPYYGAPHPGEAKRQDNIPYQNGREGSAPAPAQRRSGEPIMRGRAPAGAYPANNNGQGGDGRPQGQMRAPQDAMRRADPRAAPEQQRPAQVQDSMNALAERIGLRRNFAAQQQNAAPAADNLPSFGNSAPQGRPVRVERAAPPAGYMPQQGNNPGQGAAPAGQRAGGRNAAPAYAQGGNSAYDEGVRPEGGKEAAAARFNPAAVAGLYRQERENPDRGQRPDYESGSAARGRAPAQPEEAAQLDERRSVDHSAEPEWDNQADGSQANEAEAADAISAAATEAAGEMKRAFPSDVEHSTENLLRPFIARWLDEHFRDLFEKILREEVQRFIHSMHRDE